ncbi:transglutaminase family protein [Cypionkella sinensis]|uniref:Transglutaminase domain-containing protein n=1 Tax=Cypionkella sinensis TaxID=1756043 RepID=A0ABV7ITZ9_9RHOB
MLLSVDHVTHYRYDRPVRGVVQSHRLMPSKFDGQKVLDWSVTMTGGTMGSAFRDGAGDWVQGWTVAGPVDEIEVRVKGLVQTTDLAGILRGHREVVPPEAYLRDTDATVPDAALTELGQIIAAADSPLSGCHALSEAISAAIVYTPGATRVQTTAAQALAQGQGVCQDHAQALIAAARVGGVPARYVSGYLQSGQDGLDHEAAHAWAELFVPGIGWIGFDPANQCCPDARYIRLGSGLDAQDAAPIRGISRGSGSEILSVTVAVQTQEQ